MKELAAGPVISPRLGGEAGIRRACGRFPGVNKVLSATADGCRILESPSPALRERGEGE
jgi:hypothetical protein